MKQTLTRYLVSEGAYLGYAMIDLGIALEAIEDECTILSIDHDKVCESGIWYVTAVILYQELDGE